MNIFLNIWRNYYGFYEVQQILKVDLEDEDTLGNQKW